MADGNGRSLSAAVLVFGITLAACAGSAGSSAGAAATAGIDAAPPTTTGAQKTAVPSVGIVLDQEWATAALVDVSTGESFRIADHAGKVIIIETMAIWCSSCLVQQRDVVSALQELDRDRVVYVVLDVDPNEDGASLAKYRERNGFAGRYAVAEPPVARALAAEFGDQVLNPPATPVVFIGTDGRVTLTGFGHKSIDELIALAKAHGA